MFTKHKVALMVAVPLTIGLASAGSVTFEAASADSNYGASDDGPLQLSYLDSPYTSGTVFDDTDYQNNYGVKGGDTICVSDNDNLGYPVGYSGVPTTQVIVPPAKGTLKRVPFRSEVCFGYAPTAPGPDSFVYSIQDVDGDWHQATVTTQNAPIYNVVPTPQSEGASFYNPNSFDILMQAWDAKDSTDDVVLPIKAHGSASFTIPTKDQPLYDKTGTFQYVMIGSDRYIIYSTNYIVGKSTPVVAKKTSVKVSASGNATLVLASTSSTKVTKYLLKWTSRTGTKHRVKKTVKAGSHLTIHVKKLKHKTSLKLYVWSGHWKLKSTVKYK